MQLACRKCAKNRHAEVSIELNYFVSGQ